MSGWVETRPAIAATSGIVAAIRSRDTALNLAIACTFILLMAFQLVHHALWRDETNAWGIVLASPSLPALFQNLHYEGHPGLWHLLLWCASWITQEPVAMKAVQAVIATGFILLIATRSPFGPLEKILLLLNYYAVFEYAAISRNYGIGLFLALVYVDLRVRRPDRLFLNAIVLGLLANTNIYATILSGALALELAFDRMRTLQWPILRAARNLAPAASVYLAFILLCAATIAPAHDISWRTTSRPFQHIFDLAQLQQVAMGYLEVGIVPTAAWLLTLPPRWATMTGLSLLPVLWAGLIWSFRRDGRALCVLLLTVAGSAAFGQIVYPGTTRHWGIAFIALVVAWWMQRSRSRQRSPILILLLSLGIVASAITLEQNLVRPYSHAGSAAQWLRDHNLRDAALIGTPDTSAAGVAGLLHRPMYFLDCSCADTFLRFQDRRDSYRIEQFPERMVSAIAWAGTRPALLVSSDPVSPDQSDALEARSIHVAMLAAFTGAIAPEEDFYLYSLTTSVR